MFGSVQELLAYHTFFTDWVGSCSGARQEKGFILIHILFIYRCLELEILTATYSSQSVRALKMLQGHMLQRRTQAEESLAKLRHAMGAYEHLDPKFQDLLKEYSKLQEDIRFAKMSSDIGSF